MFILSLTRIIKFSLQSFARNVWLSLATLTIIVLTLLSVTVLVFVNALANEAIGVVKSKVDVSVYFKPTASQEQIFSAQTDLQTLKYVKAVRYVSKAEALEKLRARYQDSPLIMESLKELAANPLGDTLVVSTHETADYQKVIDWLNTTPPYAALIDNKSFDDNRYIIEKLEKLSSQLKGGVGAVTVFFALLALLVIVNTIRIAIYTYRDEVAIMKLVGASNAFVRGPFLGEALLYAGLGTALTIGLAYLLAYFSEPYVRGLLGPVDFSLVAYLNSRFFSIFLTELIGIIVFSSAATAVALSRYLRV